MTNQQIILLNSIQLKKDGIIKGCGIYATLPTGKGEETKEIELPEAIHTYQTWRKMGRQVMKGQKAIAKFPIWKYVKSKPKKGTEEEETPEIAGHCIRKCASFFTLDQTEAVKTND